MSKVMNFEIPFSGDILIENVCISVLTTPVENLLSPEQIKLVGQLLHKHSYCELFLCKSGELSFLTEKQMYFVTAGNAVLFPPDTLHRCIPDAAAEWSVISFRCTRAADCGSQDVYRLFRPFAEGRYPLTVSDTAALYVKLEALHHAMPHLSTLQISMAFASLLIDAATKYSADVSESADKSAVNSSITRLFCLNQIINAHFMENLSRDEVAGQLFLSVRQLSRIIRKYYGTTFRELILDKRLCIAEHLLCHSALSVDDIISISGFSSSGSFYRFFYKRYGMKPALYRRQNGGTNK